MSLMLNPQTIRKFDRLVVALKTTELQDGIFSNLMCSSYGRDNCANYFRLQGTLSFNTSIYIFIKIMKSSRKKKR